MNKALRIALMSGLVVLLLLAACAPNATAQDEQLRALEEKVNLLSTLEAEVSEQQSKLEEFETKIEAMETEAPVSSPFEIAVAQYMLDTAGFHGLDEALNETKQVEPAYLSTVRRVHKVLANAIWPDELKEDAEALLDLLEELETALEADDGETAAFLASEVHEAQHGLSHAIDESLGAEGGHGG